MSTGADAGPSSQPGEKRKQFWEYSQEEVEEQREEEVPPGEEEYEEEIESESDSSDDDLEEEAGTTDGERNIGEDDGTGGSNTDGTQSKKRNRKPTKVGVIRQEFTVVTAVGIPKEPERFSEGYGRQVAAILRNTVPITTINLRSRENIHYCQLLINKLHGRYKFPEPYDNTKLRGNKVNTWALRKMSKALSSWKTRVKRAIFEKNKTWEELKEKEPLIDEATYNLFKARCESEQAKAASAKGKAMRSQVIGNHRLGAGGYKSSKPKWDKEDAEYAAAGIPNPFQQYKDDPQTEFFVRARSYKDKATSKIIIDPKIQEFTTAVQAEMKIASSQESSVKPAGPWDNAFNRALNKVKKVDDVTAKPSSAGRVVGFGADLNWSEYYGKSAEQSGSRGRKARRTEEDAAYVRGLEEKVNMLPQLVQDEVAKTMNALLPDMMQSLANWQARGGQGPIPVPSMVGSNSGPAAPAVPTPAVVVAPAPTPGVLVTPAANTAAAAPDVMVTPPATIEQPGHNNNAPGGSANRATDATGGSAPSVSCMPAVIGGVSSLADLDALKEDTPCILLQVVDGELKDVAKGKIIQPQNRIMHNMPMAPEMHRVQISLVISGYERVEPPIQPPGYDEDEPAVLSDCFNQICLWPKSQMRLMTGERGTTPRTTPLVIVSAPHDPIGAQQEDDDLDDDISADQFINTLYDADDLFMPPAEGACQHDEEARGPADPAAKPACSTRLFAASQDMSPAACAFTEPQADATRSILSPSTLHKAATEQIKAGDCSKSEKKKGRKRKKSITSSSQPSMPIRAQDGPPRPKDLSFEIHVAGRAMLPKDMLDLATSDMQSVHHSIMALEKILLREENPSYPVFMAKVPLNMGFINTIPADMIILRFSEIFNLYHLKRLDHSLIRLFSLSLSMSIRRDKTPSVAILDPFYMRESILMDDGDAALAAGYITDFMLRNADKDSFLMTYSPNEDQDCVLICFSPQHSHAVYLDSGSVKKKDYKYIMRVLDDALVGYIKAGGKIMKHKFRKNQPGVNVFNHVTQFPCVKQPAGSVRDAYYALHHMRAIVQEQRNLTLPSHLRAWAERKAEIADANLKEEFFHIQAQMATIIRHEVQMRGSIFHSNIAPSNGEIEVRLKALRDTRPFMTKEGCRPFPEPSQNN